MTKKVKVGLLMESFSISSWQFKMLENIINSKFAEISVTIILNKKRDEVPQNKGKKFSLFNIYYKIDRKLFKVQPDATKQKDAQKLLSNTSIINAEYFLDENQIVIKDEILSKINKANLDVIITLLHQRVGGDLLKAAKLGVWGYKFGEHDIDFPEANGFFEVMTREGTTRSILFKMGNSVSEDLLLYESYCFTNNRSVHRNINKVYWKSLSFVLRKLKELYQIGDTEFLSRLNKQNCVPKFRSKRIFNTKDLNNWNVFRLIVTLIALYAIIFLRKYLLGNKWSIFFKIGHPTNIDIHKYEKIVSPKNRSFADPFIVKYNNKYYIFVEDISLKTNKGDISVIEMNENGCLGPPRKILEKPYHLSYPFVFKYKNNFYLVPETGQNKTIELYKCIEFPYRWEFHKYIMENVYAYDTTLFFYDRKWWLFANIVENEGASANDELFLFYAHDLFTDNWTPHPLNPIVSDSRRARPAGRIFIHNGCIIRPSQNNTIRYGYGIKFNRIITLNETEYKEVEIGSIEPKWDFTTKAIHTINFEDNITVIDRFERLNHWFPKLLG